jgi:repressor LexA
MGKTPAGETRERIYRFVRERLLRGLPPTVREVQEAFGFRAVQTAREHLEALVSEGRLEKRSGRSRGYRLPGSEAIPTILVPLLGRVQAGKLSTAVEDLEGYIPYDSATGDELFALRVRGDSMSGAGILDGDVVVVRRQESASHGEIVVALVDDEATVKRLHIRRGRAELHAENPAYEPIIPPLGEMKLLGKVIELRRTIGKQPLRRNRT